MAEPVKRATDIEEATNRWFFHPISTAIVPVFARLKITPNMVSLAGMASGVCGALLYRHYAESTAWVVAGFFFMCLWHVLDGADGQLARLTNSQSEFGKIIDGLCDYAVFATVYIGLGLQLMPHYGPWIWALIVGAGVCHALQAGAYETQRQLFDYWALAKPSAAMATHKSSGFAGTLNHLYSSVQRQVSGFDQSLYDALQSHINPGLRASYRAHFAPTVHSWSIFCANYRTFAVFLCCLFKRPEVYFFIEAAVLTLVHILLVHKQKRWNQDFRSLFLNSKSG